MKPTEEQKYSLKLAQKNDLIKIDASAGCGKTSTLVHISNHIRKPSLYMAYNKSMADEARSKFPSHITVLTTHGLAYRYIGKEYAHKLNRPMGRYVNVAGTGSEIARYYNIPDIKLPNEGFISKAYLGLIAKNTVNRFEQSVDAKLEMKHIPKVHREDIEKRYPEIDASRVFKRVFKVAESLWEDRKDVLSEVLCTHDTYLKLFQLSNPSLNDYQVIYLDEAQDSNPVILDIFMNQEHAKRILVGDHRQSIYQWRGATNAMQKVDCVSGKLTKSFRFGEEIANIAKSIIKSDLKGTEEIDSKVGTLDVVDFDKPYTMLFRKNSTLVYEALNLISDGKKISINIDVKDFVNMLVSAVELFMGNIKKVKHESILPFTTWFDLLVEAKTDPDLKRISAIIENGDANRVIELLHQYKANAEDYQILLTTSHKAKGLEYDQVVLADDFPSPYNEKGEYKGLTVEEENLLYVASTRAKLALQYNSTVEDILLYEKSKPQS